MEKHCLLILQLFKVLLRKLKIASKTKKTQDLIQFTDEKLVDSYQIEKAAFFDRATFSITVNREFWRKASSEERLILATMEVFGLLNMQDARYETAAELVRNRAAVILSIPLPHDGTYVKPGWRIAGRDPDQFGRLTEEDVLIDAGVLGKDVATTQRLIKFLENPFADAEWSALLKKAETQRRAAYLLVSSPQANRVAIVALYKTKYDDGKAGGEAYWLQLTKSRQVYEGPCAGEATSFARSGGD